MILAAFLGAAIVAAPAPTATPAPVDRFPGAAASYLVAVDGRVVWERRADTPRPPASLTKMMTALVVLERDWDPLAIVTVSAPAAAATGSRAGLRAGDRVAAGELFTAMLVGSSNDACAALAEHAGGSTAAFVSRMNARAAAMGLPATHFANPCGHDDPEQRSSARDLRTLAEAAMARPEIAAVVKRTEASIATSTGRTMTVKTGNLLLGRCPGVYGVKTGYTPDAGKCLVAAAERNGKRVLIVLLNADNRWWNAAALIEAAFGE